MTVRPPAAPYVVAVDDEPDIRVLIELILGRAGFRVHAVATGEDGLRAIAEETPDVVLLDIFLPGISGWDVAERLASEGTLPELPVLMLSAHADPGAPDRAQRLGCRGFLGKPFDPDGLVGAIRAALPSSPS